MSQARVSPGRASPRRALAPPSSLLANLAASPFVNRRPVQRFTMAAWVVGALLTGINVLLWVQYRHESTALRGRLTDTRAAIDRTSKRVVDMDEQLRGLRLPAQNAQVGFLNDRIAERTFPWSLLFERIATTLPDGVRLLSLTPVFDQRDGSAGGKKKEEEPRPAPEDEVINLKIHGAAKTDESLYQLIDAFFASPAFAHPRLFNEATNSAEVEFTVEVDYKPRFTDDASHQPAAALQTDAGDESAGGEEAETSTGGAVGGAEQGDSAQTASAGRTATAPRIVEATE